MEHRWGRRVATSVVVRLEVRLDARPGVLTSGRLRNASLSGGYVEGVAPLPVMTCVHVELEWGSGKREKTGRVRAHVVRSDSGGLGVEWADFAPAAIRTLISACDNRIVCPAAAGDDLPASKSPALLPHGASKTYCYSSRPPTGVVEGSHTAAP